MVAMVALERLDWSAPFISIAKAPWRASEQEGGDGVTMLMNERERLAELLRHHPDLTDAQKAELAQLRHLCRTIDRTTLVGDPDLAEKLQALNIGANRPQQRSLVSDLALALILIAALALLSLID